MPKTAEVYAELTNDAVLIRAGESGVVGSVIIKVDTLSAAEYYIEQIDRVLQFANSGFKIRDIHDCLLYTAKTKVFRIGCRTVSVTDLEILREDIRRWVNVRYSEPDWVEDPSIPFGSIFQFNCELDHYVLSRFGFVRFSSLASPTDDLLGKDVVFCFPRYPTGKEVWDHINDPTQCEINAGNPDFKPHLTELSWRAS